MTDGAYHTADSLFSHLPRLAMTLTTVDSSMVHAVGYDQDERELEVVFKNGGIYRYKNVDQDEYEGLMEADSKGRYMRAHIIDVYPYYKIG